MQHLNFRTLDISDQRHHITAGRLFRGFGPLVIGTTGGLALFVTGLQLALPEIFMVTPERFFALWISAAAIATLLVSLEMIARKKHHHGGLADEMVQTTIEQFLPAGFLVLLSPWCFIASPPRHYGPCPACGKFWSRLDYLRGFEIYCAVPSGSQAGMLFQG